MYLFKRLLLMFVFMFCVVSVSSSKSINDEGISTGVGTHKIRPGKIKTIKRFICNSGKNMRIIISPNRVTDKVWLGVRFIRSERPFVEAKPEPGECTLFSRVIGVDEPDLLEIDLRAKIWVDFSATGASYTRAGILENIRYSEDQKMAKHILNVVRSGRFFTVEAYDTGKGYFKIVSVDEGIRLPR